MDSTKYAKIHQDEMKTGIMKNAGLSESDIQKMKDGQEMSDAEKLEMANRKMKEKRGISMGDL